MERKKRKKEEMKGTRRKGKMGQSETEHIISENRKLATQNGLRGNKVGVKNFPSFFSQPHKDCMRPAPD